MAYRNGSYIAFDGQGESNPSKSDFRYYSLISGWSSNPEDDFAYVNSHDKTSPVRDSSRLETLQTRIRERLANSKNIVVILSTDTRYSGSQLSYEIEQAVDKYELPLLLVYVDYEVVAKPKKLKSYWPNSLVDRIEDLEASAIHIPFKKNVIMGAITQFDHNNLPSTSLSHYSLDAHLKFGCNNTLSNFDNLLKKDASE